MAHRTPSGEIALARFPFNGLLTESYRSLLYLEQQKNTLKSWTGPEAIERYLASVHGNDEGHQSRLIQSLKSFLSSRTLTSTEVFGRRQILEELIARILRDLREKSEAQFGMKIRGAVAGRPVRFVGSENEDDDLFAQGRLEKAFRLAGFESVRFEMEPVGAAHHYEATLQHDELILIGDFGGGTSDFSLVRVGPEVRKRGRRPEDLLGNSGVGLAGDAFDAKIIRHLVSPALGAGTDMRSMEKVLPVPGWVYAKLERWHHLSFLKARETMNMLSSVRSHAFYPERIEALIHLIQEDLGYQLHRAVQRAKSELSTNESARFQFDDGAVRLDETVMRVDFEKWIGDELSLLETCVDSLLKKAGVAKKQVDMVFLTGGTSFVPAVRRIFETRFGKKKIKAGGEFTSVARGLALIGAESIAGDG